MINDNERRWGDSMSEAYERWLAPVVFDPFALDLARRAEALRPRRLLEIAAGTGVVTRRLRGALPDAEITATDLNEAMVTLGRSQVPEADWQRADALDLPFPDDSADVVVCQFGVMFFPDKRAGYAEMRRVLSSTGTVLVNTWDVVTAHDWAAALTTAVGLVFPDHPPAFITAVPHGYTDPDVIQGDLRSAGFHDVRLDTITLPSPPATAADVAAGFCLGTPLRGEIEARADLAATTERIAAVMENLLGTGPVNGRMTAHVIQARSL